jgi:hypothetical protein
MSYHFRLIVNLGGLRSAHPYVKDKVDSEPSALTSRSLFWLPDPARIAFRTEGLAS